MYVCIYVCMYACVCVRHIINYIHTMCMYVYIHICMYVHKFRPKPIQTKTYLIIFFSKNKFRPKPISYPKNSDQNLPHIINQSLNPSTYT